MLLDKWLLAIASHSTINSTINFVKLCHQVQADLYNFFFTLIMCMLVSLVPMQATPNIWLKSSEWPGDEATCSYSRHWLQTLQQHVHNIILQNVWCIDLLLWMKALSAALHVSPNLIIVLIMASFWLDVMEMAYTQFCIVSWQKGCFHFRHAEWSILFPS